MQEVEKVEKVEEVEHDVRTTLSTSFSYLANAQFPPVSFPH